MLKHRLMFIGFNCLIPLVFLLPMPSRAADSIDAPRTGMIFIAKILGELPGTSSTPASQGEAKKCLQAFDRRLKEALNGKTYSDSFIECVGCELLEKNPPVVVTQLKLSFYREHQRNFTHIAKAWSYAQQEIDQVTGDVGYSDCGLSLDASTPNANLCTGTAAGSACHSNAACVASNPVGCSKKPNYQQCSSCN